MKYPEGFSDVGDIPFFYRSVEEIRGDVEEVRRKIHAIEDAFSPRGVIVDLIADPEYLRRGAELLHRYIEESAEERQALLLLEETLEAFCLELREAATAVSVCFA